MTHVLHVCKIVLTYLITYFTYFTYVTLEVGCEDVMPSAMDDDSTFMSLLEPGIGAGCSPSAGGISLVTRRERGAWRSKRKS